MPAPLYAVYTRRLRARVAREPLPHHVAVILDGNRRWARHAGLDEPGAGHRRGANKLVELIGWCSALEIAELTVWALSNENLSRAADELVALLDVIAQELAVLPRRIRTPPPSGSAPSVGSTRCPRRSRRRPAAFRGRRRATTAFV